MKISQLNNKLRYFDSKSYTEDKLECDISEPTPLTYTPMLL